MQRLVIVSNRLPISVSKRRGRLNYQPSAGGLATGLSSVSLDYVWIGWPGYVTNKADEKEAIGSYLGNRKMIPIFLTNEEIEKYYEGFSNRTIWPLFHYFTQNTVYDNTYWDIYQKVNGQFRDVLLEIVEPDDLIWIHDYHLMLLPCLLRRKLAEATIGFFLHIPFPSFEIFRSLPWRTQILKGLLGADLVGFHTYDYVRHFNSAVLRILGLEHTLGRLNYDDRTIKVDSFPMGIDYDKYATAPRKKKIKQEIEQLQSDIGPRRIILSIDRLDYTKGILQRLQAFHHFLHKNPRYVDKVILILIAVPSRSKVETYRLLKNQIDELVGKVNGEHGKIGWTPVWYIYRFFPFDKLTALYSIAEVAMITPYRDGMNLVAKEFVATKQKGKGVLIISEMAGAATELGEALLVNPNDIEEIADALLKALEMPVAEQGERIKTMQTKLKRYNVNRWAHDFIEALQHTKDQQRRFLSIFINESNTKELIANFEQSYRSLFLMDYDGALVPFAQTPEKAKPDSDVLSLLEKLSESGDKQIVLMSGRDKMTIQNWFGHLDIQLVAEHGACIRELDGNWQTIEPLTQDWKVEIRPVLELYVDRTPGSLVEEKEFSLVWHYRNTDVGLGEIRARELLDTLLFLTSNLMLQVVEGDKALEIKNIGVNKGRIAANVLSQGNWDFILAIGYEWADEDMFRILPKEAHSINVGLSASLATYTVKSYKEIRNLLKAMVEAKSHSVSK